MTGRRQLQHPPFRSPYREADGISPTSAGRGAGFAGAADAAGAAGARRGGVELGVERGNPTIRKHLDTSMQDGRNCRVSR